MFVPSIESPRLTLRSLSLEWMQTYLATDFETACQMVGLHFPADSMIDSAILERRVGDLGRDASLQSWLLRAIGRHEDGLMIGYIGFHDAPNADYLQAYAPGGLEIGYTIFEPYRQRGYATEACRALMEWAHTEHGIERFVVSISPQNLPSLRIAQKLGFENVGSHIDEEDGEEDIFVCQFAAKA